MLLMQYLIRRLMNAISFSDSSSMTMTLMTSKLNGVAKDIYLDDTIRPSVV